jgi:hypothetical protein
MSSPSFEMMPTGGSRRFSGVFDALATPQNGRLDVVNTCLSDHFVLSGVNKGNAYIHEKNNVNVWK